MLMVVWVCACGGTVQIPGAEVVYPTMEPAEAAALLAYNRWRATARR